MARPAWSAAVVVLAATSAVIAVSHSELGAQVLAHNSQALANMRTQAEAGDPLAQYDIGALYHDGRGVPQDDAEAARWYERAAEQGFVLAQLRLGILYAEGRSLPPDNLTAHMWLSLATRSRGDIRNRAVELRETVAAGMPPAEIVEAGRRALAWEAAHPQQR